MCHNFVNNNESLSTIVQPNDHIGLTKDGGWVSGRPLCRRPFDSGGVSSRDKCRDKSKPEHAHIVGAICNKAAWMPTRTASGQWSGKLTS